MVITLIILLLPVFAAFIVGYVFECKLIKRVKHKASSKGSMVSPLFAPTGEKLMAFNASKFKKFNSLPMENVFVTSHDNLKLAAKLYRGTENVTVICCHAYKSMPEYDFCAISEMYLEKGYSLLLPYMRAHGESEGKYIGFGTLDCLDVKLWVEKAEDIFPGNAIFLHGLSMGANAVMNTADLFHNNEVQGIISDCGFTCPYEVFANLIGEMHHLPKFPFLNIFEAVNMLVARYDFHSYDARSALMDSNIPFAYICGTEDKFVPSEMLDSIIYCRENEHLIVPGAGHAACYMCDTEGYKKLVIGFIEKYRKCI